MLFVHVGKRSSETLRSSRSQMFFKIGVLKSFSIFAKKHLCSSFFFNKAEGLKACIFIKKVFSCEYCKIFKNSLLVETFSSLYFYVMIEFFGRLWVQNWRVSYFLYYCFVFLHNSSVRIRRAELFRTCFYTNIFSKRNFRTHYNVGSSINAPALNH